MRKYRPAEKTDWRGPSVVQPADPPRPTPFAVPPFHSLLGDIVNSVCRSFVLDTYGGVTTALKRVFALQLAVEDLFIQVVIEITALGRRKGSWRLVSDVRKGGLVPIQECERDIRGGITRIGPGDSQIRFPRSHFFSMNCGHIPGSAVPLGEIGGGRERPPFLPPGSAPVAGVVFTRAAPPGRVAPVPTIPSGRLEMTPVAWPNRAC